MTMADKEKKEIMIVDEQSLRDKIYVIRGQQVMLDFDLAEIYGYSVSAFNQQIKRNVDRFPEDFMFKLSPDELPACLKSQNVILNESGNKRGMHIKKMPNAFTESGCYMLMTVLKGELAIEQSKVLIRLFKSMKDYLIENQPLISQKSYVALVEKVEAQSAQVQKNTESIANIEANMVTKADLSDFMKLFDSGIEREEILILDGEPFKADVAYQKIYRKAKRKIIVVDDYIGVKTLNHLVHSKQNTSITIISDNKARPPLRLTEYNDFLTENPGRSITFIQSAKRAHDRYIILDEGTKDMKVYHCGASSKDAGNKITTITRLTDIDDYKNTIRNLLGKAPLILK